jgi:pimeloyl-ACP methyl ester carboxylesterase
MTAQYLDINGTRVAVHQSSGDGPPALLVHGNSASARAFWHQLEGPLGQEFRLYAIDLPGHGQSEDATDLVGTYSLPGYARVVVAATQQLGITDAVFVGWSLGGHILLEACPQLPDATGFCIFGTPPLDNMAAMARGFLPDPAMGILFQQDLSDEEIRVRVAGMFQPGAQLPDVFIEDVRRSDGRFRTTLLNSLTAIGFLDEVQIVGNLTQPLAVLHGGRERLVNGGYIATVPMPTLWRGAVQTIAEASHTPQWETPAQFDALLGAFLRETAEFGD